jgi:hypothetical protein
MHHPRPPNRICLLRSQSPTVRRLQHLRQAIPVSPLERARATTMHPSLPASRPAPRCSKPQRPLRRACSVDSAHHNRQRRQTLNRPKPECSAFSPRQAPGCSHSHLSQRTAMLVLCSGHRRTWNRHRIRHRQPKPQKLRPLSSLRPRKRPTHSPSSQLLLRVVRASLGLPRSLRKNRHPPLLRLPPQHQRQRCQLSQAQLHHLQERQARLNCQRSRRSPFRTSGFSWTLRMARARMGCTRLLSSLLNNSKP